MEPPQHYRDSKNQAFDSFNGQNRNSTLSDQGNTTAMHRHTKDPQNKPNMPVTPQNFAFPNRTPTPQYGQQSFYQTPAAGGGFRSPSPSFFDPTNQFMQEPVAMLAKTYGGQIAEQGKQQIEKYVSISQLKYYFDVDNSYVGKKLGLLLFPFAQKEWSVHHSHDQQPISPRNDINAPDLYIPVMAFVTYIVIAGIVLGMQNRFSPEQLGVYASSALMWLVCENIVVLVTKYVMNISQSMRIWDTLAFCGYKYVSMNICLVVYLCFDKSIYYCILAYCSLAIVFFLIRSVKGFVLENVTGQEGRNRKLYLLLVISLSQPFIVWWLTSVLTSLKAPPAKFELPPDFEM